MVKYLAWLFASMQYTQQWTYQNACQYGIYREQHMVYAFSFQVACWMPYSPVGTQPLGFAVLHPFRVYPWQAYLHPVDGHWPTPGVHWVADPSTALKRADTSATQSAVLKPFQQYGGDTALRAWQNHLIPPLSLHDVEGSCFLDLVPPNNTVNSESVVSVTSGEPGVVIWYQVDELTLPSSA